jgi:hypothetical protein
LRTFLAGLPLPRSATPRLFDDAFDFRVLSGSNQPPHILPGEHKYEHTAPWFLRSGIAQQFPVHMRDGDFLPQEANIDLVELQCGAMPNFRLVGATTLMSPIYVGPALLSVAE